MRVLSVLCVLSSLLLAPVSPAADLAAYTEDLPPLSHEEGGRVRGFSAEVLALMAKEAGLSLTMEVMPWSRAFNIVQQTPDTVLFTTVRTAEREPLFRWVGPLGPRRIHMYALAARKDIRIRSEADLLHYRNGALFGSAAANQLAALGLQPDKGLDVGRSDEVDLKKLLLGRVDLVAMLDWAMSWHLRQMGLSEKAVRPVWLLDGGKQYWFAVNPATSPGKIARLQAAFDRISADGRLRRIRQHYRED